MKLVNNSANPLSHGIYKLPKGVVADIPDNIAQDWLKIRGVNQYVSPADLEKAAKDAEKKVLAELEAAKKENDELKQKIADLEKAAKDAEKKTKKEDKETK